MGIGSSQHNITSKSGIGDLRHNVFVGKSDNIAVLWGIVLVLVLSGKKNPGPIVSFPSSPAPVLDLKPFEVGLGHV
jgi:hypothetical protein